MVLYDIKAEQYFWQQKWSLQKYSENSMDEASKQRWLNENRNAIDIYIQNEKETPEIPWMNNKKELGEFDTPKASRVTTDLLPDEFFVTRSRTVGR